MYKRPADLADVLAIARRIKAAREAKGLTQSQVAEAAGMCTRTCGRLERGRMEVTLRWLLALCRTLDVSADWLLFGKEESCAGSS